MLLIAGKHPDSHQMSYTPLLHNEDPVLNDEFLGKVSEEDCHAKIDRNVHYAEDLI